MGKVRNTGKLQTDVCSLAVDEAKIAHLHWTSEEAVNSNGAGLVSALPVDGDKAIEITDFAAEMPCARTIRIVVTSTTAESVKAVSVIVEGRNIAGESIKETLPALSSAGTAYSKSAFSVVEKIIIPAVGTAATINIGWTGVFGLPFALANNAFSFSVHNGKVDTTELNLLYDENNISRNTFSISSELNGTPLDLFIVL